MYRNILFMKNDKNKTMLITISGIIKNYISVYCDNDKKIDKSK